MIRATHTIDLPGLDAKVYFDHGVGRWAAEVILREASSPEEGLTYHDSREQAEIAMLGRAKRVYPAYIDYCEGLVQQAQHDLAVAEGAAAQLHEAFDEHVEFLSR